MEKNPYWILWKEERSFERMHYYFIRKRNICSKIILNNDVFGEFILKIIRERNDVPFDGE